VTFGVLGEKQSKDVRCFPQVSGGRVEIGTRVGPTGENVGWNSMYRYSEFEAPPMVQPTD
jgi:hypothetical protein